MNVQLTKPAQADIEQAAQYYEGQNLDLGITFLDRVEQAIDRIALNPQGYAKVMGQVRRCNIDKFPYALWFRVEDDAIIIACLHTHRDPRLAKERAAGVTPIRGPKPS